MAEAFVNVKILSALIKVLKGHARVQPRRAAAVPIPINPAISRIFLRGSGYSEQIS